MADMFMRFPGGSAKALTLSYDDGVEQDIRLIEIMNKHGLKGTFNLNSGLYAPEGTVFPKGQIHRRLTLKQATELYKNSGQEVAVHTVTHPFLEQLPPEMAINEVIKDRENLEKQFGTIIRGMAYPYGTLSDRVVELLKYCGIAYSRTTEATYDFRIPQDWLRLSSTCHHTMPELQGLTKSFIEDKVYYAPYLFYLWGHSYEFEADNNWSLIEEFAEHTGNRSEIWYATNIEVYDYIEAYRRLIFSVDGSKVMNPTNKKLWFEYADKMYEIDAGAYAAL